MICKAWAFLLNPENRTVLAWLGGGALAAAVAILGALLQAPRPSSPSGPASNISAQGGVAAGTITGGTFTIGPQPPAKPEAPR
jgi:hypothetical protein